VSYCVTNKEAHRGKVHPGSKKTKKNTSLLGRPRAELFATPGGIPPRIMCVDNVSFRLYTLQLYKTDDGVNRL